MDRNLTDELDALAHSYDAEGAGSVDRVRAGLPLVAKVARRRRIARRAASGAVAAGVVAALTLGATTLPSQRGAEPAGVASTPATGHFACGDTVTPEPTGPVDVMDAPTLRGGLLALPPSSIERTARDGHTTWVLAEARLRAVDGEPWIEGTNPTSVTRIQWEQIVLTRGTTVVALPSSMHKSSNPAGYFPSASASAHFDDDVCGSWSSLDDGPVGVYGVARVTGDAVPEGSDLLVVRLAESPSPMHP